MRKVNSTVKTIAGVVGLVIFGAVAMSYGYEVGSKQVYKEIFDSVTSVMANYIKNEKDTENIEEEVNE